MKHLLFIGLGRMGSPIAGHLSATNLFNVSVYNRSPHKMTHWLDRYEGSKHSDSHRYDGIVLCVGNDDDVREILTTSQSFVSCLKPGAIVIDHTTTSAQLAVDMHAKLAQRGIAYLDAPVSGGEAGAVNAHLSCMVGGDKDVFERSKDILSAYCHNAVYIGNSGSGQLAKMANQFCVAGALAGLSEAICLIEKAGVNADNVYRAIKGGAAQSWQLDNRFQTMVSGDFDFGFAIKHMIKDLNYALEETQRQGWIPAVAQKILSDYRELLAQGKSEQDTSVLIEKYRR